MNKANEKPCAPVFLHGRNQCRCERCAQCGYFRHDAIHMPHLDAPSNAAAYGHEFVSSKEGRK